MTIHKQAFTLLVQMGQAAKPAMRAIAENREKLQGAYNLGVQAAVAVLLDCKGVYAEALPVFIATVEKLESDIRFNRDGLAVKFGAEKRAEPSEKGEKYKVPGSVSNVKSTLKFALENNVELHKEGTAFTYGQIRKSNSAVRDALERAKGQTLTGIEKLRWSVEQAAIKLRAKIGEMDEAALKAVETALAAFMPADAAPAEATPPAQSQPSGEALAETAEAPKPRARGRRAQPQRKAA